MKRPLAESMPAPAGAPGPREKVRICGGWSASLAIAVKLTKLPASTVRSLSRAKVGGVFGVWIKFAERGVKLVMRNMDAPPSGNRPWLTSVNCGPKVTLSMREPSGAKRAMALPFLESEKLT